MTSAQRHTWWLWDKFKSADKDGNGELEAKEVKKFFKSLNLEMDDKSFKVCLFKNSCLARFSKEKLETISYILRKTNFTKKY